MEYTDKDIARFWSRVDKTDDVNSCWEWTAAKINAGYGQVSLNGTTVLAHRFAWVLHFGDIPEGLCVLHKCDNRGCVRPDHLWLGTKADNQRDMVDKGRSARLQGEDHGRSKLTEAQAILIKNTYPAASQYLLADVYGIDQSQISRIINGDNWRHLT